MRCGYSLLIQCLLNMENCLSLIPRTKHPTIHTHLHAHIHVCTHTCTYKHIHIYSHETHSNIHRDNSTHTLILALSQMLTATDSLTGTLVDTHRHRHNDRNIKTQTNPKPSSKDN